MHVFLVGSLITTEYDALYFRPARYQVFCRGSIYLSLNLLMSKMFTI